MVFAFVLSPAAAQTNVDALELSWSAPAGCGDVASVREAVRERLGELRSSRTEPLAASGGIEATPSGFALSLRTPTGERRLEAASCEELVDSAAVILALLIDPRATPGPESEAEPEDEPEAELQPEAPERASAAYSGPIVSGYVRAELFSDLGLLPSFALGPGFAIGFSIFQTTFELSGAYLPAHDLEFEGTDVGDLSALIARLGVCQMFFDAPSVGPCFFVEYLGLAGRPATSLQNPQNKDATLWSLLPAARLSIPLGGSIGWVVEVGISLPTSIADFKVEDGEGESVIVHDAGKVSGRLRTGLELRFP